MSLINQLQQIGSAEIMSQIGTIYENFFPMEIRFLMSDFLESRLVNNFCDHQRENEASAFVADFISELRKKASHFDHAAKVQMEEIASNIGRFNSLQVLLHLKECIGFERRLLNQALFPSTCDVDQVSKMIQELAANVKHNENLTGQWMYCNDASRKDYEEMSHNTMINDGTRPINEIVLKIQKSSLDLQTKQLQSDLSFLSKSFETTLESSQLLVRGITEKFVKLWQWNRKFHISNVVLSGVSLDTIQSWCEKLGECLWYTREQIRTTQAGLFNSFQDTSDSAVLLNRLRELTSTLIDELISKSFVVDRQPSTFKSCRQILKKDIKFSTSVRLLTGKAFGIETIRPAVRFLVVSENQAKQLAETNSFIGPPICKVSNSDCHFEYNEESQQFVATFSGSKITEISRPSSDKAVTVEKFALLYQSTFPVGDDLKVHLQTLSLPIALVVHVNQEPQARTSLFWDNSFSLIDRLPFEVPEAVTWKQFSIALNQFFIAETDRGLTPENLHFLAEKFFNRNIVFPVPDDLIVTWTKFSREKLTGCDATFWGWFYSSLRVTRDHFRELWQAGLINGFIKKATAEELLRNSPEGTFILRFSDTILEGISIAWLNPNADGSCVVRHIRPFESGDLKTRSLAHRICDLDELKTLHPNLPKRETFQKFLTVEAGQARPWDYWKPKIKIVL